MGIAREDEYNEMPPELSEDEIDLSLEELSHRMRAAGEESLRLTKLYAKAVKRERQKERQRVPDPGWDHFAFEVRFNGNRTTYHFAARRMNNGAIYTTGANESYFPTWGLFVRWLRQDDKVYVSPLTKLEPTNLIAVVRS